MRVLVAQTGFLGDLVLTTPLLFELRRVLPEARLDVLTTPTGAEVFAGLPVDDVVLFDKRRAGVGELIRVGTVLHRRRYTAVVAAHRSLRTSVLVRASAAPRRIGFRRAPGAWAYTETVPRDLAVHAARRFLALARPLGGDPLVASARPRIVPSAASELEAERLLGPSRGALLCLAPGSVWPTKRWPAEGFAAVARAARGFGLTPVLVGAPGERALCEAVARGSGGDTPVLAGATSVAALAAVLRRSMALVANDSGAAHVASAVGTPVISIFGPTVPAWGWAPLGDGNRVVELRGLACRPCGRHGGRSCPLGDFRCMRDLPAQAVIQALESVIARRAAVGQGWSHSAPAAASG